MPSAKAVPQARVIEDVASDGDEKKGAGKKGKKEKNQPLTVEELPSSAPLVLGEREIEALIEVAYAYAKFGEGHDLRKLFEAKGKDKPQGHSRRRSRRCERSKYRRAWTGRCSAECRPESRSPAWIAPFRSLMRWASARCSLWQTPGPRRTSSANAGAGHISTRELISGVFLLEVYINVDDLRRNIPGLSADQERDLIEMIVASVLRWQPVAMVGSTAPYADPGEAMIVIGDGQPFSLARAFERPCEHITEVAWERLRAHAEKLWSRAGHPNVVLTLEEQASVEIWHALRRPPRLHRPMQSRPIRHLTYAGSSHLQAMLMRFFTMHLAGSVASTAGVQYDAAPSVLPVPTRSMITGMLGGAMGWSYRDHVFLQELQDELDLGFVVTIREP